LIISITAAHSGRTFFDGGTMKVVSILTAFLLVYCVVSDLNAGVYTWTDENGVRHYSDHPPEDAKDAEEIFPAYEYDEAADRQRSDADEREIEAAMNAADEEELQEQQEMEQQQLEAARNQPPTREERITAEKEKLEQIIVELEEKPLDYFGSQRNKIIRIGYYKYRLEALEQNPDEYFENPQSFEGNIKVAE
jgi:hypothetical protein